MKQALSRSGRRVERLKLRTTRTERQTLQSVYRWWHVEDSIIALLGGGPGLAGHVAAAGLALQRMDEAFAELPHDFHPWVWPIRESERGLVLDLQQKHAADPETLNAVSKLLSQLLEVATVDEVAQGAIVALQYAKWDASL